MHIVILHQSMLLRRSGYYPYSLHTLRSAIWMICLWEIRILVAWRVLTWSGIIRLRLFPRTSEHLKKNTLLCFETSGPVNFTSRCDFQEEQKLRYKNRKNYQVSKIWKMFFDCGADYVTALGYKGEHGPNDKEQRLNCNNSHIIKLVLIP